jgi:AGZA family xanthine/uracil permease-like MFS transporter
VPRAHYAAVVLAMIPNLAAWAVGYVDDALGAAGTSAAHVGLSKLAASGVIYDGLHSLGSGATLAGMVLGGIAVFLIDRRFLWAAGFCMAGAGLALVGLIHGDKVHIFSNPSIALGYALAGVCCVALCLLRVPVREPDPSDAVDLEAAREAGFDFGERIRPGPLVGTPVQEPAPA